LLQGLPMAVAVSTSFDAAFSRWRTQAIVLTLGGAVFVACSLTLLVVVRREMRSLAASETSLREKSESLEQSIVERSAMEKRLVQSQKARGCGSADRRHRARFQQSPAGRYWQSRSPERHDA